MKKRMILMTALAALVIISAAVQPVMAYFTDAVSAEGTAAIKIEPETEIIETFDDWTKTIVIKNDEKADEGNVACWVRARVYSGDEIKGRLNYEGNGKWEEYSDGWWWYTDVLEPGEETTPLVVKIDEIPAGEKDSFNVAVVYASVQALYKNGELVTPPDWTMQPVTVTEGGQG